jgi:hypothetical protein
MKIKILISCSGNDFSYAPGRVIDADDAIAADLIAAGYAEEVLPESAPAKLEGRWQLDNS